ncbi:MAG: hypothetical protein HN742_42165 [Lentisphaerae bacterium]|jgi:hypothetical protein|nr:hypothetical protein [Lentisphaerota bacterium]MBT5605910.1 hypothetical protein [Lentisphaerota bacterium]MBT7057989.1 hypothetical protein [Lentisphaerota bacterium]MBT7848544.1 hypothetical protein [Lentisphaerota bacterium]
MRPWPAQHRNLAVGLTIAVVAVGLVYMFVSRPKKRDVADLRGELEEKQMRLVRRGWPLNSERLGELLKEMNRDLDGKGGRAPKRARDARGIKNRADLVLSECTSTFDGKVREQFGTTADFVRGVSRLDYQEEFNRLTQEFGNRGIILDERILKLGEETSSPYTYQLVLHIWTVEMLVKLALEHKLTFLTGPPVAGGGAARVGPAQITVMPMQAYLVERADKSPYLLEFPVRMRVKGALVDVGAFLGALQSEERFLPCSHFELTTEQPTKETVDKEGRVRISQVMVELECCAFFSIPGGGNAQSGRSGGRLPGA